MAPARVLIIEDDAGAAEAVALKSAASGYEVTVAPNGSQGLKAFNDTSPDIVILDLMLPDMDGTDVCRQIRAQSGTPVIMLTARAEEASKIVGLEIGADDYVTKPFSPKELISRIKAVLRRSGATPPAPRVASAIYQAAGLSLDLERHEVLCDGDPVRLTPTEYKLLALLIRNAGQVVSRETIIKELWGYEGFSDNLIEIHIGNLRRKIEAQPRRPRRLITVRAFGYKLLNEDMIPSAAAV